MRLVFRLFGRLLRRRTAHGHPFVQHVVDVLYRLVFGVDFAQRVAHDAQVAPELWHQRRYLVRVAQDLHTLRVRVVTDAERFLNVVRELPAIRGLYHTNASRRALFEPHVNAVVRGARIGKIKVGGALLSYEKRAFRAQ